PSRGSPTTLPGPSVRRPAWVRNPHSAGVPAPRSSVRREPPSCASSAVRVIHGSPPGLLVLASAAAADAPDGRTALFVPPLRPALNALAVLQTTRAVGPVLVGSRRFAPFPWDLRASMKADISTLLKPDILILRRQVRSPPCEKLRGMLPFPLPKEPDARPCRGHDPKHNERPVKVEAASFPVAVRRQGPDFTFVCH